LSPVGIEADAEDAGQRVQLVGQRHAVPTVAARQRVAGKARLVVILDGVGDVLGLGRRARRNSGP
jgi:hypothetical protein